MDAQLTPNWPQLRLLATVAIPLIVASCVPAKAANDLTALKSKSALQASAQLPARSPADEAAFREQFSRKVAELLLPVSSEAAAPFDASAQTPDDQQRSLTCLADAIYYEARSEPEDGQRAVAQVVLNRVRHPAFPSTVCGVVFQGSERRTGCQFSFTCDGSMYRPPQGVAWERARRIAAEAIAGSVYAPVGNATHYHTTAIMPYWARYLHQSAIVGSHIFYRWGGTAGEASAFRQRYGGLEPEPSLETPTVASDDGAVVQGGVTIHSGTPGGAAEQIALDDGTVTIHRGGKSPAVAVAAAVVEDEPAQPTAGLEEGSGFGVTVHRGSAPTAG